MAKYLCQQAGQSGEERFKPGTTEKGDDNSQRSGEVAGQDGKQKAQDGADRRDLKANKQDRDEATPNICTQIRKRSPGEMVDLQGSSPPNSRMVNPEVHKIKQRQMEACMDQQGTPDKAQAEKGSTQEMEIESSDLERIWRHSPTVQGWC